MVKSHEVKPSAISPLYRNEWNISQNTANHLYSLYHHGSVQLQLAEEHPLRLKRSIEAAVVHSNLRFAYLTPILYKIPVGHLSEMDY